MTEVKFFDEAYYFSSAFRRLIWRSDPKHELSLLDYPTRNLLRTFHPFRVTKISARKRVGPLLEPRQLSPRTTNKRKSPIIRKAVLNEALMKFETPTPVRRRSFVFPPEPNTFSLAAPISAVCSRGAPRFSLFFAARTALNHFHPGYFLGEKLGRLGAL